MKCQDIPRELSTDPVQKTNVAPASPVHAEQSSKEPALTPPRFGRRSHHPAPPSKMADDLYVPKVLFHTATSYAELVKQRLGERGQHFSPKLSVNIQDAGQQHWARHY